MLTVNQRDSEYLPAIDVVVLTVLVGANIASDLAPGISASIALVLLIVYWLVDYAMRNARRKHMLKWSLILTIFFILVAYTSISLALIQQGDPSANTLNDSAIQTQDAMTMVLSGLNPYATDFTEFTMGEIWPDYRALYHYAYYPATFLFPLPAFALVTTTFGWFDLRIFFQIIMFSVLLLCGGLTEKRQNWLLLMMVLGLNPIFTNFLIRGGNDVLVLFWVSITVLLLQQRRPIWAALTLAIACVTKQFAWFFVPFFFIYLSAEGDLRTRIQRILMPSIVFVIVFFALLLPWVLPNPHAFYEDTWLYLNGSLETSWLIQGIGFRPALQYVGVSAQLLDSSLLSIFQVLLTLLVMGYFGWRLWQRPALRVAFLGYALSLFTYTFLARFFNASYLGYITSLIVLTFLMKPIVAEPEPREAI